MTLFHTRLATAALLAIASLAPGAGQAQDAPTPVAPSPDAGALQLAWTRVLAALTPAQQAWEVRRFLDLVRAGGPGRALEVDVRDLASGRAVPLDDPSILQRPQAHQATVVLDGRFYEFQPLSRASLEPLIAR
ncbi:hypothetical protein [Brevundimonas sp.]|uniref:hypothetical protein n=1 Tax=Brevundimonas sp. TaxID=1871086 RepID=UPI0019AFFF08|nr:hypothetical protein [Brevundimonas sp.]MBD3835914.1 hypothetical protein [Brevundimonas sp.]